MIPQTSLESLSHPDYQAVLWTRHQGMKLYIAVNAHFILVCVIRLAPDLPDPRSPLPFCERRYFLFFDVLKVANQDLRVVTPLVKNDMSISKIYIYFFIQIAWGIKCI